MAKKPKGPLIIELEQEALPDAPSPAQAPPPTDIEVLPESAAGRALTISAGSSGWGLGRAVFLALGSLLLLWLGIAVTDFATGLFARAD